MRHGSLFSGIGGFDLAARWMGWENVFQVEWDKWCQKVLAKNFPDTLRFGDIVEFNKMLQNGEIITDARCFGSPQEEQPTTRAKQQGKEGINIGRIDILTGGFPCQPFSHAGKRKGIDDSRYLWPEMLTTIRILKPSFVVGENVAGLVSMENGKTLDRILSDLANEGYTTEQFIIPACGVGAWHRRDRIWIIAYSKNGWRSNGSDKKECDKTQFEIRRLYFNDVGNTVSKGLQGRIRTQKSEGFDKRCENISDTTIRRLEGQGKFNTSVCTEKNREWKTDAIIKYNRQSKSQLGRMVNGLSNELDGYWDREPEGVSRVATGIKNRVNRLKGLGNAIVPQVAFELFKAIEQLWIENLA